MPDQINSTVCKSIISILNSSVMMGLQLETNRTNKNTNSLEA